MKNRIKIVFRVFSFNRLTFPLLLNVWERNGIDRHFDIRISDGDKTGRKEIGDLGRGDAVVYSFMTPHLPLIAGEIETMKKAFSPEQRPLLVAGGPHVSGEQKLALAIGLDRVFAGDGEDLFLRFGQDLLGGGSGRDPVVHEDEDRDAPWHSPAEWERYIPVSRYMRTMPPLEIMRGCFWKCRYCQTGTREPQFRSLDSVARYLEEAARRGTTRISFISPSALEFGASSARKVDPWAIDRVLALTRSRGFRFVEYGVFPSEIRPDTVTDDALAMLKRFVSNRKLTIGAQSGIDERLSFIARGHGTQEVERAVALANARGFRVNLDLIIAYPGETADERMESLAFFRKIGKRYRIHVQLHHFFPLAGSPLEFRFPSFLHEAERRAWRDLKREGIASDWWVEGEKNAKAYFGWLKRRFPDYRARYC